MRSTLLVVPRPEVSQILRAINLKRPSILTGTPGMFAAMTRHPHIKRYDLSSVRFAISSGMELPERARQQFERLTGCKFVESYGIAEAAFAVTCNPVYGAQKGDGVPLPDTECQVVDIETGIEELPPDIEGELRIKGPQVMQGYCGNPGETILAVKKGWLYTGDIARMDDDGYFHIVDRKKDIIRTLAAGEAAPHNIYPSEIERTIATNPKVLDVAVVGVPDPARGQTIQAYVVLRPKQKVTTDEIMSYCQEVLAAHKVPCRIEFRRSLPRDILGRVTRSRLLEREAPPDRH